MYTYRIYMDFIDYCGSEIKNRVYSFNQYNKFAKQIYSESKNPKRSKLFKVPRSRWKISL